MSDCPICGGDLARVGRIRLCRSCSEAFVAIGGAATLPSATKGDVVREAIEVQDRHATALAASEARVSALTAALEIAFDKFDAYQQYVDWVVKSWFPRTAPEKAVALELWSKVEAKTQELGAVLAPAGRQPDGEGA